MMPFLPDSEHTRLNLTYHLNNHDLHIDHSLPGQYHSTRYHFHSFEWPKGEITLILPAAIFSFAPVLLCWPISIVPLYFQPPSRVTVSKKIHCKSPWTICFSIYSVSGCQPGSAVSDIHKNSHLHH